MCILYCVQVLFLRTFTFRRRWVHASVLSHNELGPYSLASYLFMDLGNLRSL